MAQHSTLWHGMAWHRSSLPAARVALWDTGRGGCPIPSRYKPRPPCHGQQVPTAAGGDPELAGQQLRPPEQQCPQTPRVTEQSEAQPGDMVAGWSQPGSAALLGRCDHSTDRAARQRDPPALHLPSLWQRDAYRCISNHRDSAGPGSRLVTPHSTVTRAVPHPPGQRCQARAICLRPGRGKSTATAQRHREVSLGSGLMGLTFICSASAH